MCSGSEVGSYLWLIDLCITQLGLKVIKKRIRGLNGLVVERAVAGVQQGFGCEV